MNGKLNESDWKTFRNSLPELREKYLYKKNQDIVKLLNNPKESPTECFWKAEERIKEEARILRDCFDGYSRSKMYLHIMLMCRYGILEKEDLEKFSEELQAEHREILEQLNK
ncbi:MAG: hypothetical protein SFY80_13635 [Verrucomicrobiota bacterium]|nr:hypothetical protein [Verrucomicrobiota bacterium]